MSVRVQAVQMALRLVVVHVGVMATWQSPVCQNCWVSRILCEYKCGCCFHIGFHAMPFFLRLQFSVDQAPTSKMWLWKERIIWLRSRRLAVCWSSCLQALLRFLSMLGKVCDSAFSGNFLRRNSPLHLPIRHFLDDSLRTVSCFFWTWGEHSGYLHSTMASARCEAKTSKDFLSMELQCDAWTDLVVMVEHGGVILARFYEINIRIEKSPNLLVLAPAQRDQLGGKVLAAQQWSNTLC